MTTGGSGREAADHRVVTRPIAVVGPTGVGKTEVTLALALLLDGEVISADSMQVYRGMDIGTAKPTSRELGLVPHHLIDIRDPDEPFSVADWVSMARPLTSEILRRGKTPIVSGGTPLYFEALWGRFILAAGTGPDQELRRRLRRQAEVYGRTYLYRKLRAVDPVVARRLHPSDTRRIVRALEVYLSNGKPLSELERGPSGGGPEGRASEARTGFAGGEPALFIGLYLPREELLERIEARASAMVATGLIDEVRGLLEAGYDPELTSMQGVGYKEVVGHLLGRATLEEAVTLMVRHTRRLAKRQMTWLRGDSRIHWMRPGIVKQMTVEDIATLAGGKRWPANEC